MEPTENGWDADRLTGSISNALAANPDLLHAALLGVSQGMARALRVEQQRASIADKATLAAMALAQGRVGKDLRETLLARVAAAIHPQNQCGYERGYIDQHNAARTQVQP